MRTVPTMKATREAQRIQAGRTRERRKPVVIAAAKPEMATGLM